MVVMHSMHFPNKGHRLCILLNYFKISSNGFFVAGGLSFECFKVKCRNVGAVKANDIFGLAIVLSTSLPWFGHLRETFYRYFL